MSRCIVCFAVFFLSGCFLLPFPSLTLAQGRQPVRIGIISTMFLDFPKTTQQKLLKMTTLLFQKEARLPCTCVLYQSPLALAKQLQSGKTDLAVFAGYEFAWVEQQHNKIKPLVIARTVHENPVAYLVVANDSPISKFSDLAGRTVALPKRSRPHTRIYLEREAQKVRTGSQKAIKVVHPKNIEHGLDDILRGKVTGTIVDRVSLADYKRVKPGCYRRLKIVQTSPKFPCTLIVYREGAMTSQQLADFRGWLLRAHTQRHGQSLMESLRLTAFQTIPGNYQQVLAGIRKIYPASDQ
ncbi:MAG: phosphate/phosphite/phosphonate ABC transporter substrate-binding protein [Gemmataceae bacterium]